MEENLVSILAWFTERWVLAPWWGKAIYVILIFSAIATACAFITARRELNDYRRYNDDETDLY